MFNDTKPKYNDKYWRERKVRLEKGEDYVKDYLNDELSRLKKLLSEEMKLKEMAEDKRREIREAKEQFERKIFILGQEMEKMQSQIKDLLRSKGIEKAQIEGQLITREKGLNELIREEESEIKSQQTELELRLQSKEEENNMIRKQLAEKEGQLGNEIEKRDKEIQELKKQLERESQSQ